MSSVRGVGVWHHEPECPREDLDGGSRRRIGFFTVDLGEREHGTAKQKLESAASEDVVAHAASGIAELVRQGVAVVGNDALGDPIGLASEWNDLDDAVVRTARAVDDPSARVDARVLHDDSPG